MPQRLKMYMNNLFPPMLVLLFCAACSTVKNAKPDSRCYELRVYYAAPGKLDDLNARFRNHTLKIFEKHGMQSIGYWMTVDNSENKLIYILAHQSREAAAQSWREFNNDPEWKEVARKSEANGRLVTRVDSTFMKATDFSPAIRKEANAQARLFELRTYKAAPGKLADLLTRFRNHTTKLFKTHDINQFGYWTPLDRNKGAEDTLIYIVDYKNREAADAAWKAFRENPKWVAAKNASEVNGSLTTNITSIFMSPTDYSPTK